MYSAFLIMNTKDNLKEIDVNPITLANNYYPKEAWIVIKNLTTLVARGSEKLGNTISFKIKWG
ncbi:hypothetical protein ACFLKA_06500 [Clostridium caseinilyticum]|uniref:hypothetical protein n=1 Tax=Clostridium caseinilyticum TaxID=3350403 RepID=UPI0013D0A5CE|nr:hypothetical protein [Clostridium sporogenes]